MASVSSLKISNVDYDIYAGSALKDSFGTIIDASAYATNSVFYVKGTLDEPNYSTASTYAVGDKVATGGYVYSASAAVTAAGAWSTNSGKFGKLSTVVWKGNTTATSAVTALTEGVKISYKIPAYGGSSNTQININGLGAKYVKRDTGNTTTHLPSGTIVNLTYDGTNWVWADYDSNSTYAGFVNAYCTAAAGTTAKVATATNYRMTTGNTILVYFSVANTATASNITLNVNSQGAKVIKLNGSAISNTNYNIPVGTWPCYYDGTNWNIWTDGTYQFSGVRANFYGNLSGSATSALTAAYAVSAGAAPSPLTAGTDLKIESNIISVNTNGTADSANNAFVAGKSTKASAEAAAAFGYMTSALGKYTFVEGFATQATDSASHAEGAVTNAAGPYSHAEGAETVAAGIASHAEGNLTTAVGNYSHAGGYKTVVSDSASAGAAFGQENTANGVNSFVAGKGNVNDSYAGTVVGCWNQGNSYPGYDGTLMNSLRFGVGVGGSDEDRKNGFLVFNDRSVVNSDLYVINSLNVGTYNWSHPSDSYSSTVTFGKDNFNCNGWSIINGYKNSAYNDNLYNIINGYQNKLGTVGTGSNYNIINGDGNSADEGTIGTLIIGTANSAVRTVEKCIILGDSNSAYEAVIKSVIIGEANELHASTSAQLVLGNNNTFHGSPNKNIVVGSGNDVRNGTVVSLVLGSENNVGESVYSTIVQGLTNSATPIVQFGYINGFNNAIGYNYSTLLEGMPAYMPNGFIYGNNNYVTTWNGYKSISSTKIKTYGNNTPIWGDYYNYLAGVLDSNSSKWTSDATKAYVGQSNGVAFGSWNGAIGLCTFVAGKGNQAFGPYSNVAGKGGVSWLDSQTIVGRWNTTASYLTDPLFVIGGGSASVNNIYINGNQSSGSSATYFTSPTRKNVFEVDNYGNTYIGGYIISNNNLNIYGDSNYARTPDLIIPRADTDNETNWLYTPHCIRADKNLSVGSSAYIGGDTHIGGSISAMAVNPQITLQYTSALTDEISYSSTNPKLYFSGRNAGTGNTAEGALVFAYHNTPRRFGTLLQSYNGVGGWFGFSMKDGDASAVGVIADLYSATSGRFSYINTDKTDAGNTDYHVLWTNNNGSNNQHLWVSDNYRWNPGKQTLKVPIVSSHIINVHDSDYWMGSQNPNLSDFVQSGIKNFYLCYNGTGTATIAWSALASGVMYHFTRLRTTAAFYLKITGKPTENWTGLYRSGATTNNSSEITTTLANNADFLYRHVDFMIHPSQKVFTLDWY